MTLRQLSLAWLILPVVLAEWDCILSRERLHWDFTHLELSTISYTQHNPPTSSTTEIEVDLCKALPAKDGVADVDQKVQCPSGTRVCLRTTNTKENEADRITHVVPMAGDIATDSYTSSLNAEFTGGSEDNSKPLTLILHGPGYPPAPHPPSTPQSVSITFHCSDSDHSPTFTNYDYSKGVLYLDWKSKAGCAQKGAVEAPPEGGDNGGGGGGGSRRRGSGIGWFFLVLLILIVAYFGLGAYYNYTQYGASGWDLLPHRDFWRDVPYLVRDITAHLCSAIRPGGSRGGYTSV
ncbi:hypothetical protein CALVIDRAFT_537894 [Calocera viscosa TUFC12733]|uniref:Autophagy-related protein 27 n=1 Tax=Calocera viscosa (strain TUFC12733) TaxID=1330018 RepID=A0A167LBC5_CALVF|nr:hypothetical protein CALVIDRAFT_537894 [Calocera viscosa TUFC12733]